MAHALVTSPKGDTGSCSRSSPHAMMCQGESVSSQAVEHHDVGSSSAIHPLIETRGFLAYSCNSGDGQMAGKKPSTNIDGYISTFPAEVQVILEHVRQVIRTAAPEATETIS